MAATGAKTDGAATTPTATPPPANQWGRRSSTWVKTRDLVGPNGEPVRFHLESVGEAEISGKPSWIFRIDGDRAFSAEKAKGTIGQELARDGVPPANRTHAPEGCAFDYYIEKTPTKAKANTSGYDLVLRPWPPLPKQTAPATLPAPAAPSASQ